MNQNFQSVCNRAVNLRHWTAEITFNEDHMVTIVHRQCAEPPTRPGTLKLHFHSND